MAQQYGKAIDLVRAPRCVFLWLAAFSVSGCTGVQSALDPAGPQAAAIDRIGWIMIAGGGAIFALILALTAWSLCAPPSRRRWISGSGIVVWGGIAFPVFALSALLVYGLALAGVLVAVPREAPLKIAVIGERWWWRVHYLNGDGAVAAIAANEVRIPTGRPVEFQLTSGNVIHSFWIPNLNGKLDMIPGRTNSFILEAERAGIYRGQCAEYCGGPHALMAFDVVAHEPEEFAAWLAEQTRPAAAPPNAELARGRDVFSTSGCGACHAVRGTDAAGEIGPDLTHVGSRLSLGAASLPNSAGSLAAWVVGNQAIKPGNLMPEFPMLPAEDLRALAAYLESLK